MAILGVLAFHTGLLPGGFLGVDLFFALSGFLITGLLLRELRDTGTLSLTRFWARRLRRLLPASAVVLAVVTLTVWTLERVGIGPADLVRTTLADGPWVQLNLVNWHLLAADAGYWDRFGQARVFEHLWSIAVEEQFYVVWPLLVLALAWACRSARTLTAERLVPMVAASLSIVSLISMIALLDPADPTRVYTGTDTRAFSLLLGAVVAAPSVRARLGHILAWRPGASRGGRSGAATSAPTPREVTTAVPTPQAEVAIVVPAPPTGIATAAPAPRAGVVMTVLVVVIAGLWLIADGTASPWLFTGGLFVHSLASALLIALCAEVPRSAVARVLRWGPLRWLGGISYSLYLWHWPVAVLLAPDVLGLTGWQGTTAVWAVSIALATASTYLLENPIRFHATWARGRQGTYVLAATALSLALLWLLPGPAPTEIDITHLT